MRRPVLLAGALFAVGGALAVVLFRGSGPDLPTPGNCPAHRVDIDQPEPDPERVEAGFTTVADVDLATALAAMPGNEFRFVATKDGFVHRIERDGAPTTVVLDLSEEVSGANEQGLLGLAVAPDGRRLYLYLTDLDGNSQLLEFALSADGDVEAASRRTVLTVEQPGDDHNAGRMFFGSDGLLYVGLGDGGDGDPRRNAQDLGSLLGSIVRIDPRPAGGEPHSVPSDNPFVGVDGARGEIWQYGLRNPWGFAVDEATGDLWVADVGQWCDEEVSHVPDGEAATDFGWPRWEGATEYEGGDIGHPPAAVFPHDEGYCSVLGGFVYRGGTVPGLDGRFVFADLCRFGLFTLRSNGQGGYFLGEVEGDNPGTIQSFGVDAEGALYLLTQQDGVVRLDPPG